MTKNLGQGGVKGRAGTIWSSYVQADIALRSETEGHLGGQCLVCVCGGGVEGVSHISQAVLELAV